MNDFDDFDDLDDGENATIIMYDDDGNETEFCIVSSVENEGTNYLLVIKAEDIDDDEAEASILKEITVSEEEFHYASVEDDEEFEKCIALFKNCNEDYDIEI